MAWNRDLFLNGVWFYLIWLSAVWGRGDFLPLTLALLVLHGYLHRKQATEFLLIAGVAGTGITIDQGLFWAGFYLFPDSPPDAMVLPSWLLLLWFGFAATLRHSLSFLSSPPFLAALFGAIGGPSSYFAGVQLGAVDLGYGTLPTLCTLAAIWAVLLPLFFQLNDKLVRAYG
ncbi:DUF2878 domain-containing protein [Sansalvadorimonas verongulae]|uniref:DUF2878 domain-containing protein n=1 Tax=Sansalvadorimonas verongulae TaxID=2172824 RepID=UPI0012BD7E4F|nr:DUF2878 domain-containing protein [Sansalvadorimonas verongulae]MTI13661.1 DUF2878 domain-containing protein [Sansalvadorimonas verongulae]